LASRSGVGRKKLSRCLNRKLKYFIIVVSPEVEKPWSPRIYILHKKINEVKTAVDRKRTKYYHGEK
jgi:hypothetical protein